MGKRQCQTNMDPMVGGSNSMKSIEKEHGKMLVLVMSKLSMRRLQQQLLLAAKRKVKIPGLEVKVKMRETKMEMIITILKLEKKSKVTPQTPLTLKNLTLKEKKV